MRMPNEPDAGMESQPIFDFMSDVRRALVMERGANVLLKAALRPVKTHVIAAFSNEGVRPQHIFIFRFAVRMVAELRNRLRQRLGNLNRSEIWTVQGFTSSLMFAESHTLHNRRLSGTPTQVTVFATAVQIVKLLPRLSARTMWRAAELGV